MNKLVECATGLPRWLFLVAAMLALISCAKKEAGVQGFVFPEGDIAAGEQRFVDYGCNVCHVVAGSDIVYLGDDDALPRIQLGGEVRNVKSYGDLLTSIVVPNHNLAKQYLQSLPQDERKSASSPMPDFNEQMTVADLIDVVEFLHSRYKETSPDFVGRSYVR